MQAVGIERLCEFDDVTLGRPALPPVKKTTIN